MNAEVYVRRLYWTTGAFGIVGAIAYAAAEGMHSALGFALGAASSLGNLWLFNWVSQAIAPGAPIRQRWRGGAFALRYGVLILAGYVIVNALGVKPLAVVLGLLTSTAAIILTGIFELVSAFRNKPIA